MSKIIKRIDFDPEFDPIHLPPVVGREVLDSLEQAKKIIGAARSEAATIRRQSHETLAKAEKEREEERRMGRDEGYEEGLGELSEKILEAGVAKEKVMKEAEPEIVRMVMEIAEKVIGREMERGGIVPLVKKAIGQAVGRKIQIRVHPHDYETLKGHEADLVSALDQTQSITLKEDEEIPAGGCVLESELGTVDAKLETQLKAIRKVLGL